MPNLTALFLEDTAGWAEAQLTLASVQPLWGGHVIALGPGALALVRLVAPGCRSERRFRLSLDPHDARAMLQIVVDHDLLAITPPIRDRPLVPDETSTTLTLSRGGRRTYCLTIWANDPPPPPAQVICAALLDLQARVQVLEPEYVGAYQG
jgi:hypothetical protein